MHALTELNKHISTRLIYRLLKWLTNHTLQSLNEDNKIQSIIGPMFSVKSENELDTQKSRNFDSQTWEASNHRKKQWNKYQLTSKQWLICAQWLKDNGNIVINKIKNMRRVKWKC